MSRPRAATSVAISRSAFAARKRPITDLALPLLHAAVDRLGAIAVRIERFDERVDLEARAAEHQRRRRALDVEHALQRRRLVRAGDDVGDLANARHLAGGRLLARDHDVFGLVAGAARRSTAAAPASSPRTAPSAAPSAWRRGSCRCPRRSPCRASRRPRPAPGRGRRRGRATAGGCDRARGPACRRRCRRRARGRGSAASSRRRRRAGRRSARCRARTCGWPRQPASRARASARAPAPGSSPALPSRGACRLLGLHQHLDHRQRERRRLAGAGRGLGQQVLTREHQRDRRALNRCRLFVAEAGDGLQEIFGEAKRVEASGRSGSKGGRHPSIVALRHRRQGFFDLRRHLCAE